LEALAVFGAPLGPPAQDLAGDCAPATVLVTERQRLELHPELEWPYRVSGTQIGVAVFRQKYAGRPVERRTNLEGDALADPRFKAFFEAYGGVPAFGYPLGGPLTEADAETGQPTTVQYFERARFELIPGARPDAPLLEQVRLGALMREYAGIAADCPAAPPAAVVAQPQAVGTAPVASPRATAAAGERLPLAPGTLAQGAAFARPWWLWPVLGVNLLLLAALGAWGLQMRAEMQRRRRLAARARKRRLAEEARAATRPMPRPAAPTPVRRAPPEDDGELLRRLLEL
jgi:hypothetical protein